MRLMSIGLMQSFSHLMSAIAAVFMVESAGFQGSNSRAVQSTKYSVLRCAMSCHAGIPRLADNDLNLPQSGWREGNRSVGHTPIAS
ncbi:uncharacterized protein BCR38DRAFT_218419 [Pseudomassariella vexata]|uniref:Secreted protein n=1 Tax=Pseudomassariella vexata TaxID=1141098 RepID=A0A1Y2DWH2_9PEZI|nr:uncharacterized protein BCR38DRAFT_218419 [Pseudomassariella vexata]ORY62965.1 hypothetical protein BCR38DRAFT_218419 [Pseudomassariella vexata]